MLRPRAMLCGTLSILVVLSGVSVPARAAADERLWSKRMGGVDYDRASSVAVDPNGDVLIAGGMQGDSIDLGGGPIHEHGGGDLFLAKYSPSGAHLWSKVLGGTDEETSHLATDPSGNVLVAALTVSTTLDMGGGPLAGPAVDRRQSDLVVAKYSPSGAHLWSKRFGGVSDEFVEGVTSDAAGNVLIVGNTRSDAIDFGGGPLSPVGDYDIFIVKFSPSGAHIWSRLIGGSDVDEGYTLACDAAGNIFFAGATSSPSIDVGGGPLAGAGGFDILIAKLSPSGAHLWSKRMGGSKIDKAFGVAADPSGGVVITGSSESSSIDLGGGPRTGLGETDFILAKYTSSGARLWDKRLGGDSFEDGRAVAIDAQGIVSMVGRSYSSSTDLGKGPLEGAYNANGADIIVAKYSPTGSPLWTKRIVGMDHDDAFAVANAPDAYIVAVGVTRSPTIDLGDGPLSGSYFDAFAVTFSEDGSAPVSTLTSGSVLSRVLGLPVTGTVTDDKAGVEAVTVSFEWLLTGEITTVEAALMCAATRRSCSYRADPSTFFGPATVTVRARDRDRNAESPGASATVLVLP